jgi:acyl dehydratase
LHLYDDTLIAFLGFENLRFTKPVKIGDTIHAKVTVTEVTETSKPDRGIMKRLLQVINQNGEVVQEGIQTFLLHKKPL